MKRDTSGMFLDLSSPLVSTARFSWSTLKRRIATSKAQGTPRDFSLFWNYFALYLIFLQLHTSFLLEYRYRIFSASACVSIQIWQGKKSLCPAASADTTDSKDYEILARKHLCGRHLCLTTKLSKNYPHARTHIYTRRDTFTRTELYYADTCCLVSLTISQFERQQTFIKTLLCYVLYVFDFSALTSPFSQDIPIYIICIYTTFPPWFLSSIRASTPSASPHRDGHADSTWKTKEGERFRSSARIVKDCLATTIRPIYSE